MQTLDMNIYDEHQMCNIMSCFCSIKIAKVFTFINIMMITSKLILNELRDGVFSLIF